MFCQKCCVEVTFNNQLKVIKGDKSKPDTWDCDHTLIDIPDNLKKRFVESMRDIDRGTYTVSDPNTPEAIQESIKYWEDRDKLKTPQWWRSYMGDMLAKHAELLQTKIIEENITNEIEIWYWWSYYGGVVNGSV